MSNSDKPSALLLVYGEGGHAEQMRRLINYLPVSIHAPLETVVITESGAKNMERAATRINCSQVRDKTRGIRVMSALKNTWSLMMTTQRLLSRYDIRMIITTGPGLAIPVALVAKLKKVHVLHIETWCRFSSKSLTGRFMELLADDFWVQNQELKALYPKAHWCGRL